MRREKLALENEHQNSEDEYSFAYSSTTFRGHTKNKFLKSIYILTGNAVKSSINWGHLD